MADASTNVKFITGSLDKFNALPKKDPMAIYFITDSNTGKAYLYKGDVLYGTDAIASATADGLMSKEDKMALGKLVEEEGENILTPADSSIKIEDKKINVAVSSSSDNILQISDDGLFVPNVGLDDVPEYTIEKQDVAEEGYVTTYKLKKTLNGVSTYIGDPINLSAGADFSTIANKVQHLTEEGTISSDYITQGAGTLILDGGSAAL